MNYVDLSSQKMITIQEIRQLNPNMSIPDNANLSHLNYEKVTIDEYPSIVIKNNIEHGPLVKRGGKWFLTWVINPIVESEQYVPQTITMGQARLALFDLGKLELVNSVINALPALEKQRALIEWEYRPSVERNSALVLQLGQALNLDLDALFILASTL